MDRDAEEEIIRRAYAKQIMAACGISDRRIETAFASVKREHFLGRGPWQIVRWGRGYMPTPSRNPVYLYDDVVVAIIPDRHLNNGQPSLHAMLIASAAPKMGEHAVHIGAGVGYYTAILHRLVGRSGRVTAIEFDTGLAARLAANFGGVRNVNTVQGDGARVAFDSADIIYVNAGATKPAEAWLDRLTEAGRLILPMTASEFPGVMYSRARYFASSVEATIFSPGAFPQWRSFLVRGCATRNPKPRSRLPLRKAGHKR
jgi:protein-L-isoaspartate(D-aspartate) O-methyltransferase